MRANEETVLVGHRVVLVPYRKEHVDKYHQWMADPQIRQQTASEPLNIEEEYDMQRSWHQDNDKLTFIILARPATSSPHARYSSATEAIEDTVMAGDVNMFLSERHEDDANADDDDDANMNTGHTTASDNTRPPPRASRAPSYDAELEVMIAEPTQRRRGLAREALGLLMHYAAADPTTRNVGSKDKTHDGPSLPVARDAFVVKVGFENAASLAMFASMGFHEVRRSTVWNEIELRPQLVAESGSAAALNDAEGTGEDSSFAKSFRAPLQVLRWPMKEVHSSRIA